MTSLQLFTENEPCLKPQIFQLIFYQIQRSGSVLESLWQANYKNDTDHLWVNDLNQPHTFKEYKEFIFTNVWEILI